MTNPIAHRGRYYCSFFAHAGYERRCLAWRRSRGRVSLAVLLALADLQRSDSAAFDLEDVIQANWAARELTGNLAPDDDLAA